MALVVLGACGSGTPGNVVVVRVGDRVITKATVEHWMSVMSAGTSASLPADRQALVKQQAVEFLISSAWLSGEAASQRVRISDEEVQQRLAQRQGASFPGGEAELQSFMKASGQSIGDLELEASSELASLKLHRLFERSQVSVTRAQIARYYAQHKQLFVLPERRVAKYTGRRTEAAAEEVKREAEAGKTLASPGQRRVGEIFYAAGAPPGRRDALERGIFASRRTGTVSGPFKDGSTYYLFEVTKVVPSLTRSLGQVEQQIRMRLADGARQRALARIVGEWRAKTDCRPGYVTQDCRQYRGRAAPEDPLAFN